MRNLIVELRGLRGTIPEYIRCMVVRRVARAIMRSMGDKSQAMRFIQCCALRAGEPRVPCDLDLPRRRLAQYIDRWLSVVGHYDKESGTWERLPPAVADFKKSMLDELMTLCGMSQHEVERVTLRANNVDDVNAELNMVFSGYDEIFETT